MSERAASMHWRGSLLQDVRYTRQQMRRTTGFTLVAVLTLSLGVAAAAADFCVIDSMLILPLPFSHPLPDEGSVGKRFGMEAHNFTIIVYTPRRGHLQEEA